MAAAEGIAVARLQKPAELSIRRWPEHEVEHNLDADGIGRPAIAYGVHPNRPNAGLKLYARRQIKRLLKYEVRVPFGLTSAEQSGDAGFDYEPIFDRSEFNGCNRAETYAPGEGRLARVRLAVKS
jgi:hypothetical protein